MHFILIIYIMLMTMWFGTQKSTVPSLEINNLKAMIHVRGRSLKAQQMRPVMKENQ